MIRDHGKSEVWPRMKQWLEESRVHPIIDPAKPIILGIDEARDLDYTIVVAAQQRGGTLFVLDQVRPRASLDEESLRRCIDGINRDMARPRGYSRSHWRKIWRQRCKS